MFKINEADRSIYVTRGDVMSFTVKALTEKGTENGEVYHEVYHFEHGEVLRFKVTEAKNCEKVMLVVDFPVREADGADEVELAFDKDATKFGDVISKPTDYWYEIELNPDTNPQTLIGYNDEQGAAILKLFPEGADKE